MTDPQIDHDRYRRDIEADFDRWNDEAAFEAEVEADRRWDDQQAQADWAADLEGY